MGAELRKVAEVCSNGTAQDLPLGRAAAASLCRGWKRRTCCRTVPALDLLSAVPRPLCRLSRAVAAAGMF